MKFQLTSIVTLAMLYGSVTATPVPADDPVPSKANDLIDVIKKIPNITQIWAQIAPQGLGLSRATSAGACTVNNSKLVCPQRRDIQQDPTKDQNIDDIFNALVHDSVLQVAHISAGACIVQDGQVVCPQRRDVEKEDENIADSIFGTAGNVIGGLWHGIVPSSGYYGSLQGAFNTSQKVEHIKLQARRCGVISYTSRYETR